MTTVIVTRPGPLVDQTAQVYRKAGFEVFESPCFAIQTNTAIKPDWLQADAEAWVVSSVLALKHALNIVPALKPRKGTKIIAVGSAVAKSWEQYYGEQVEFHPEMNSEGMIELLKKYRPQSVKILTTAGGRNLIKSHCMAEQISYMQFNTYQRIPLSIDTKALAALYESVPAQAVILTVTSAGILEQFLSGLDGNLLQQVKNNPLLVGAERIAEIAVKSGFSKVHVADNPGDQAMCSAAQHLI